MRKIAFLIHYVVRCVHAVRRKFSSQDSNMECSKCKSNECSTPTMWETAVFPWRSECSSCHVVKRNRLIRNLSKLKGKRNLENWHDNLRSGRKSRMVWPQTHTHPHKKIFGPNIYSSFFSVHIYRLVWCNKLKIKRLSFSGYIFDWSQAEVMSTVEWGNDKISRNEKRSVSKCYRKKRPIFFIFGTIPFRFKLASSEQ